MKTYTFTIDKHKVTVTAVPDPSDKSVINFCATCEDQVSNGRQSLHPKPNQTRPQVENDLEEFAKRLAHEAAGKKQSESLIDSIFSD